MHFITVVNISAKKINLEKFFLFRKDSLIDSITQCHLHKLALMVLYDSYHLFFYINLNLKRYYASILTKTKLKRESEGCLVEFQTE